MNEDKYSELLLLTAFSCMACDGHIDNREVELIVALENEENLFKIENIEESVNNLIQQINNDGKKFLKNYFGQLKESNLSQEEELQLLKTAVRTIRADDVIEYSEIRFFKIIRSKLKISNKRILDAIPDIEEYLEQDVIRKDYLEILKHTYFEEQTLPEFNFIDFKK
ncbi:hypothetical protein QA597_02475 [Marinilabiliaceae bacterium ANBcel2]|nr:hypothetical protein [Marinilabiliaceae bacterium ANBcel2]